MGIDDCQTLASSYIVYSHIGNKSGFAGAGFTNKIDMAAAVFFFDAESSDFILKLSPGDEVDLFFLFFC